jgi:hypothetical protein
MMSQLIKMHFLMEVRVVEDEKKAEASRIRSKVNWYEKGKNLQSISLT